MPGAAQRLGAGTLSTHTGVVCVPTPGTPSGLMAHMAAAAQPPERRSCRQLYAVAPVRPREEPQTCAATTRACASHRALWLWWNRRRYMRRPWSDWSAYVEMPRSPGSPVQPPATQMTKPAEIGVAFLLCELGASRPCGYSEHPMHGTLVPMSSTDVSPLHAPLHALRISPRTGTPGG